MWNFSLLINFNVCIFNRKAGLKIFCDVCNVSFHIYLHSFMLLLIITLGRYFPSILSHQVSLATTEQLKEHREGKKHADKLREKLKNSYEPASKLKEWF